MTKEEQPQKVRLTQAQADELVARVSSSPLSSQDIQLVTGLISFNLWLSSKLELADFTISRLRKFMGFKSEKKH
jgi:hypothetical protein